MHATGSHRPSRSLSVANSDGAIGLEARTGSVSSEESERLRLKKKQYANLSPNLGSDFALNGVLYNPLGMPH